MLQNQAFCAQNYAQQIIDTVKYNKFKLLVVFKLNLVKFCAHHNNTVHCNSYYDFYQCIHQIIR